LGGVWQVQQGDLSLVGRVNRRGADLARHGDRGDFHFAQVVDQARQGELIAEQAHRIQRDQRQLAARQVGERGRSRVQDTHPLDAAPHPGLPGDDRRADRQSHPQQVLDAVA
jgi:hypothetical protein